MASRSGIEAGRAFVRMFLNDEDLTKRLASLQGRMRATAAAIGNIGSQMATAGIGMSIAFGAAMAMFVPFSDALLALKAATGDSGLESDFQQLSSLAKELGRTSSYSATQVAQLMTELARAGFNPTQIQNMTASVLNLARASGTDATMAAGIMSATLRQFQLEATDAAHVADVLTHAANATFNSVESLGEALKYAGPVAGELGMSLEDTAAILGTLGNVGIQGSEAGTVLRRLAVIVAAEADKMQQIFGVAAKDAAGNARPLVTVLGEIKEATKDMSDTERIGKMNEAFGLLGITAASVMSGAVVNTRTLATELNELSDTAKNQAAVMDSGIGGSLKRFMGAVEGVAIAVSQAVEGPLKGFLKVTSDMLNVVTEMIPRWSGVLRVLAAIGPVLIVTGATLMATAAAIKVVVVAIGLWMAATKAQSVSQAILLSLSGPKGILMLGAAAVAAAGSIWLVTRAFDAETEALKEKTVASEEATKAIGDVQTQLKEGGKIPPAKLIADDQAAKIDEADESMRKLIVSLAGLRGATAEVLAQQSAGDALTQIGLLGGDAAQISAERLRKYVEDAIPPAEQLKRKLLEVDAAVMALGSDVPEGLSTTLKLDILEQSTGALSSIRELRDEIALLSGNATESGQDIAKLAEQGVPPEILNQYRQLREERDRLQEQQKQEEEAKQKAESEMDSLRQRAAAVRNETRTPQEKLDVELKQLQKLKATLDPNTGTPLLDEQTYQRALRKLHEEQLELAGRDAERLRSPKVQSDQDVRSVEGSKMLIDLLNGRNDTDAKTLQAMLIANRQRSTLITLTERQGTLRKASTRNS